MFKDSPAFSGFSINDVEATRHFYGNLLGMSIQDLPGMEAFGMLQMHIEGGHDIIMYHKDDHQPATFTVLSFPVDDIDTAVDELQNKGIEMIKYEVPEMHQDEKGIARGIEANQGPDIAWFSDPSGNVLAVLQESRQ